MLTVLAGHCSGGAVPASTRLWVEALRTVSDHVVLVYDNAPLELPEAWQDAPDLHLHCERHGEYDFGSYKRGLALAQAKGLLGPARHVLLCNDSVVGPLAPLEPLMAQMRRSEAEAWGLILSRQRTPHLQSWFVVLGREVISHPVVASLLDGVCRQPSRHAVIEAYELGLSRAVLAAGFPLHGWIEPSVSSAIGNPSVQPISLVHQGVPLIKKRALREESANAEGISATCRLIAQRHPQLWSALVQESPQWRFWRAAIPIAVLLDPDDATLLQTRLDWLAQQPHPRVRLLLPVPEGGGAEHRAVLHRHQNAIASGQLQLVPVWGAERRRVDGWNACLAACHEDWIGLGSAELWCNRFGLHQLAGRIAREPALNWCLQEPTLVRRDWLLSRGGFPADRDIRGWLLEASRQPP